MSNISLWDAHAHIQAPWFSKNEIQEVIQDATSHSIEGIINVISTPTNEDYSSGISLAKKYPVIHTNFGLQPTEASNENFTILESAFLQYKEKICAIGEVGLDYHWVQNEARLQIQKDIFIKCVDVANEYNIPLVIHSRKAEDDCLDILEKHAHVPVLMHGMEATEDHIQRLIDLNYYITIPTSVCNRKKYKKIALRVPLELMLLETDSPFQLPFNLPKGEEMKNTPVNINLSVKRIADIKNLSLLDVAATTTKNVKNFFNVH